MKFKVIYCFILSNFLLLPTVGRSENVTLPFAEEKHGSLNLTIKNNMLDLKNEAIDIKNNVTEPKRIELFQDTNTSEAVGRAFILHNQDSIRQFASSFPNSDSESYSILYKTTTHSGSPVSGKINFTKSTNTIMNVTECSPQLLQNKSYNKCHFISKERCDKFDEMAYNKKYSPKWGTSSASAVERCLKISKNQNTSEKLGKGSLLAIENLLSFESVGIEKLEELAEIEIGYLKDPIKFVKSQKISIQDSGFRKAVEDIMSQNSSPYTDNNIPPPSYGVSAPQSWMKKAAYWTLKLGNNLGVGPATPPPSDPCSDLIQVQNLCKKYGLGESRTVKNSNSQGPTNSVNQKNGSGLK